MLSSFIGKEGEDPKEVSTAGEASYLGRTGCLELTKFTAPSMSLGATWLLIHYLWIPKLHTEMNISSPGLGSLSQPCLPMGAHWGPCQYALLSQDLAIQSDTQSWVTIHLSWLPMDTPCNTTGIWDPKERGETLQLAEAKMKISRHLELCDKCYGSNVLFYKNNCLKRLFWSQDMRKRQT